MHANPYEHSGAPRWIAVGKDTAAELLTPDVLADAWEAYHDVFVLDQSGDDKEAQLKSEAAMRAILIAALFPSVQ